MLYTILYTLYYIDYVLYFVYFILYTIYYILHTIYIWGSLADLSISYRENIYLKVYLRERVDCISLVGGGGAGAHNTLKHNKQISIVFCYEGYTIQ